MPFTFGPQSPRPVAVRLARIGLPARVADEIEALIAERHDARNNRDFARSDEIRDLLAEKGIILEDTKDGVRWKRKN